MTDDEIRAALFEALLSVAPETDTADLDPKVDLREQCDLDSMDFLNFVFALHKSLGVDIAEADYPNVMSIEKAVEYLRSARRVESSRLR